MGIDKLFLLAGLPFVVSLGVTYFATPLVIKLAWKLGLIDDPKKNKHPKVIHTYPVPRGGGIAIFLGILVTILVFMPLDQHLKGILMGALVIVLVGIADDKYNLNPYFRLFLQFLAASLPIISGIGIAFLTNPFNGVLDLSYPRLEFTFLGEIRTIWVLSDLFALFWLVFLMNILNMGAKGVDGQLPGVVAISAITIAALSLKYSADITQWPVIILAAITAGAYIGFLPWNFFPQKIMPSHSGSTLAGYLLGVLAILSTTKVGTLLVVLGIPTVDTIYTIVRRIVAGKSPVWGDRGHLHHKLLDSGMSKRKVVLFYWLSTGTLGILALNLNSSYKLYTIGGITLVIGGLLLWLNYIIRLTKK